MDDCLTSNCPCCLNFLKRHKKFDANGKPIKDKDGKAILDKEGNKRKGKILKRALCKTENCKDPEIGLKWGEKEIVNISGKEFNFYNFEAKQKESFIEILSVLPKFYLDSIPTNLRIGDPRRPNNQPKASEKKVGGGSRRCKKTNDDYEYIIVHPEVWNRPKENPVLTILHEAGHFIDKKRAMSASLVSSNSENFSKYLKGYKGDSKGNDEVIAQGIMYYFSRKYFNKKGVKLSNPVAADKIRLTKKFPKWLRTIIQEDIDKHGGL